MRVRIVTIAAGGHGSKCIHVYVNKEARQRGEGRILIPMTYTFGLYTVLY